jgi:hypothetical protein
MTVSLLLPVVISSPEKLYRYRAIAFQRPAVKTVAAVRFKVANWGDTIA